MSKKEKGVSRFTEIGIPKVMALKLVRSFNINNDAKITELKSKPTKDQMTTGNAIVCVKNNGDAIFAIRLGYKKGIYRGVVENGEMSTYIHAYQEAMAGVSSRKGKIYELSANNNFSPYRSRHDKEDFDLGSSAYSCSNYYNKVFRNHVNKKIDGMIDFIYDNLRKLSNVNGPSMYSSKTEQEQALVITRKLETLKSENNHRLFMLLYAEDGRTAFGKVWDTVPNANAKFAYAKIYFAKKEFEVVEKMVYDYMIKKLTG